MRRSPVVATVAVTALLAAGTAQASSAQRFILSPSGNVSCELDFHSPAGTQVFCETFEPAQSVTMTLGGRLTRCHGQGCIGQPPENARRLSYGRQVRVGAFACTSAATGMSCVVTSSGHGFEISRDGVTRITGCR
jgi:hypothetical protein